ncbi:hypothetical protein H0H81_008097, partial [Sphagnurus paluster]
MSPGPSNEEVLAAIANRPQSEVQGLQLVDTDVFIAGSGPIACTYARKIIESGAKVLMAEIGSQDSPIVGEHHKNSIKYQRDIDAFVNVIRGALQNISTPPADTFIPTLGGNGWTPSSLDSLIFRGSNPNQERDVNLKASAVTRTVGGMATHWTCACPFPDAEERKENPINKVEFDKLLQNAYEILNVHPNEYNDSIRHTVVKEKLLETLPASRRVQNLPLAVERRTDNPYYVTWTGSDTVLGDAVHNPNFQLRDETRVTRLVYDNLNPDIIKGALVKDLRKELNYVVRAKVYVVACGAIGTPQILANSGLQHSLPALGRNLCEQSLAFCQIVLKREIVDSIPLNPKFAERVAEHKKNHPKDPLPIPFPDPEPQIMIPYTPEFPHHVQVHRDAFSYGDVGPRADSRVVVDLRFFGKQDINENNLVYFGSRESPKSGWLP